MIFNSVEELKNNKTGSGFPMKKPKHKKKNYKKIAKQHGVTPQEVEMEITEAIKAAYNAPAGSKEKEAFTKLFPHGKMPSNEEFINRLAKRYLDEKEQK